MKRALQVTAVIIGIALVGTIAFLLRGVTIDVRPPVASKPPPFISATQGTPVVLHLSVTVNGKPAECSVTGAFYSVSGDAVRIRVPSEPESIGYSWQMVRSVEILK